VFVPGAPLVGARIHAHALDPRDGERDLPRRLDVFRTLDRKGTELGGRFAEEPRLRALVRLQRAAHAELLGEPAEAERSLLDAFDADPTLREDAAYLFWWLAWMQRRRIGLDGRRSAPGWVTEQELRGAAGVVAGRAVQGETAYGALVATRPSLATGVFAEVAWGLLGNELESAPTPRRRAQALRLAALSVARDPRTARSRRLRKLVLCACGVWAPALRTRARLARPG
jgi:hypothetical protein